MKKINYFLLTKSIGVFINCLNIINPKRAGRLGFELFCRPRDGKLYDNNIPNILKTAKVETFISDAITYTNYVWQGIEKTILLVHGWESNTARWEKLMPFLLKTGYTIVAFDGPAHGLSGGTTFTVPNYTQVMQRFTEIYNPNIIIGHSIGGITSIYYQFLNQNPNVEKMVILGSPSDLKNLINNYCKLLSLNSKTKIQLTKTFAEALNISVDAFSAKKFAANIATKALIVHDQEDRVVAFSEAEKIISTWKNAAFISTNGLGHSLHDDDLNERILEFLLEN